MKMVAHFSIFSTLWGEMRAMLSSTCSYVRDLCRYFTFEKNLSAKHIICSSNVSGRKSCAGSGQPLLAIFSFVRPVPVWRSHTRAWAGYPSFLKSSAPR